LAYASLHTAARIVAIVRTWDVMTTSRDQEVWSDDPELVTWLLGIHFRSPRWAGRFLTSIASAARYASPAQYAMMRPLLLSMKAAHPEFHWETKTENSSKPASE